MKKVLIAFGTRPEVIKLAPVIKELKGNFELTVLHSGQHKELVNPMLSLFRIEPDINLNIMQPGQDLFELTQRLLPKLKDTLQEAEPDYVIVQGDTTTSYLTALAAFYKRIPVLHVEAGLRSHNPYNPFPEEMNRKQISHLAHHHFAPTQLNQKNLLDEGISSEQITVTGNTVIDAMEFIQSSKEYDTAQPDILSKIHSQDKLLVLTAHRRENHGKPLLDIFKAVNHLLESHQNLKVIFPAHPNPNIEKALLESGVQNERLLQTSPFDYLSFLHVLDRADVILSDSGGIQEEASALGKHVLVLRNETERQELIDSGLGTLVGTEFERIVSEVNDQLVSNSSQDKSSIFGDGKAAEKIREVLLNQL
ncbi:MAG: UDP-N-acetylglucosamine 2-epimerase (non-hydrolyzing) [Balneola sp.]|jgi:UDP-N-acetylglucosamine 2-epimerase (non-hydrolysing)|nr:UDP-N-acetylglucosamine 2-epimerase (non-hydrolyzing) [Balneola sp.]MBE79624.1 UDP-N-acetylglucosamine 2-epimerase (non-hydrolyzing) [Balneola sp.]|tara:strand:+ start:1038 stop:2132 length:1095 start_codon:yes stop_codon:yes gene_type:complete